MALTAPATTATIAGNDAGGVADTPLKLSRLLVSNLATHLNLGQQNAVANQQSVNEMSISIVGACVNFIASQPFVHPPATANLAGAAPGPSMQQTLDGLKAALQAMLPGARAPGAAPESSLRSGSPERGA